MDTTADLLERFEALGSQPFGARFFKVDLHFHTPASEDARGRNRYDFNPYRQDYPADDGSPDGRKRVGEMQARLLEGARAIVRDIVRRFAEEGLSMVAVTDHNSIGTLWTDSESDGNHMDLAAPTWYELIDEEARRRGRESGTPPVTILPGVEISTTGVHILAVFPPQNPRRKIHFMICDLLNAAGIEMDDWGRNPKVGSASVIDTVERIVDRGGVPIPAHIDGSSQALLDLYRVNSGAMKNVLQHGGLGAVEIVDPEKFTRTDRRLKRPLNRYLAELRRQKGLRPFAYFQGSDAHDLPAVGKRFTYVKMTAPTFSGLRTAIKMPASRVRISDLHAPATEGLYVRGMTIEDGYFGRRTLRFNRHLNCVVGGKGSGKSRMCALMQAAVPGSDPPPDGGRVTLFVEKIVDGQSRHYAFDRPGPREAPRLFHLDPGAGAAAPLDAREAPALGLEVKFYRPVRIAEMIRSEDAIDAFLQKYLGPPAEENVDRFNAAFAIGRFLETEKEPLLAVRSEGDRYRLHLNVNWRSGKTRLREILSLSHSMRKTAVLCMIVVMSEFGPAIVDAPEREFDNRDVSRFLVPVIKAYKDRQQIIVFSSHPIFAVNTDPDNYVLLETSGTRLQAVVSGFAIDDLRHRPQLLDIVEGGLEPFRKRGAAYET